MNKTCRILLLLSLFSTETTAATEKMIFGLVAEKNNRVFALATNFLKVMSEKLAVDIELISLPGKRAAVWLQSGKIHADLSRIAAYQKRVPNSIKIPEPLLSVPYYAYSSQTDKIRVDGWDSLKPYKIVSIRGYALTDEYLKHHDTHKVGSIKAAFGFLQAKRAELFIIDLLSAETYFATAESKREGITKLEPPVALFNTYTFFSSKYPRMANRYHQALNEMKREGTLLKILLETK